MSEPHDKMMTAEVELEVEELEEVIAPGRGLNHNETLVCYTAQ